MSETTLAAPSEEALRFHPSMQSAVAELGVRFPDTPFLTLGQTVLWDEPVKAAFCRALETLAPEALIIAGVHDTDYFAKLSLPGSSSQEEPFVMLEHNDGDTRDLWSAAGEISALFGSETVPTRQKLTENGVAFDRVAKDYPGGIGELLNCETAAWGWRALVHTQPRPLLAGEVLLRDISPKLLEQVQWAFEESLRILGSTLEKADGSTFESTSGPIYPAPCESREVAARILGWIKEYVESEPQNNLSQLYRYLTSRLWALVRNAGSCNLETSHSLKIFRFNKETYRLPRFAFLNLFLDPATRETACRAYNAAVRGSGIYTLEQFGEGALPFDVVIPDKGRGTLSVLADSIRIETETPIVIKTDSRCESAAQLAEALEAEWGREVVVVGKAVTLISMLAQEMIFVFHERASGYTRITQEMNRHLREGGIKLNLRPLLRLEYSTWDALGEAPVTLQLPFHLARAFGKDSITAAEFSTRWKEVCAEQDEQREALKLCRSLRELLRYLSELDPKWETAAGEYRAARKVISEVSARARVLQEAAEELRERAKFYTRRAGEIECRKGEDFRARVLPLREKLRDLSEEIAARINPLDEEGKPRKLSESERTHNMQLDQEATTEIERLRDEIASLQTERTLSFDRQVISLRKSVRQMRAQVRSLMSQRVEIEKSDEAVKARATIAHWEYEAELERLRRVRDAISVSEGLRYTNLRPTAWWLPLVSPDGKWFEKVAATIQARIEEL